MIDRSEVNRALAKAIAYKQAGNDHAANLYAAHLIELLGAAEILSNDGRQLAAISRTTPEEF